MQSVPNDRDRSPSYWAFISYSHHDEAAAVALHRALETYRLPRADIGRETGVGRVPPRLYPCFRDRDELGSAPSLGPEIQHALSESRALIVVCSPSAAASKWVNEEIRYFRSLDRGARIFAYLVEGEPHDAFPPALTEGSDEPLAADMRASGDGKHAALVKLVAGITGIPYADLTQRDAMRRLRERNVRLSISGSVAAFVFLVYMLLADAGAPVPLGNATRTVIDHYGLSILRPVPSEAQLQASADALRTRILASNVTYLQENWKSFLPGPHNSFDTWSTSQYAAAAFRARRDPTAHANTYLGYLATAFEPGMFHRTIHGEAYGWYGYSDPAPWPEPALWMGVAVIDALEFPNLLSSSGRTLWTTRLRLAQSAADAFGPHDGHWEVVPNDTDASQYDTYAAAMALMETLNARHAGLGWDGSAQRRDQIGRDTSTWLVAAWLPSAQPLPRWNPDNEQVDFVDYAGLTLQIYGELLQAQQAGYVTLPSAMMTAIDQRLEELTQAQIEGDRSQITFRETFLNERLRPQVSVRTVSFAMLPSALYCTAEYLAYLRREKAPRERIAPIARVAGRMLTTAQNLSTDTSFDRFAPAEAAFFLSAFDRSD